MAAVKPPAPRPPVQTASTPSAQPSPTRFAPVADVQRPATPNAITKARIQELIDRMQDAYFDYDQHILRTDSEAALQADAKELTEILRQYPTYKLSVEGYCDERGSDEYNIALGDARARKAKEFLVSLGVPAAQLRTVSYGKERQVCNEHDEACWQRNRRAHITQDQNAG
ncbi:MAG TPA: OmpA family protein [Bryobacteraceae bacterium]|nr:OmpA family protein [Bryobacteraceae bacterium]